MEKGKEKFKKVVDQIDNFINDPKGTLKKAIDHAPEEFKKAGDNIVREAEKSSVTFMKAVEKADDQLRYGGSKLVDKVKSSICDNGESCGYKDATSQQQESTSHETSGDDIVNMDGHEGL